MNLQGAFTLKRMKKQLKLPLIILLAGTLITIFAVFAYKGYLETVSHSKAELNATTYAEHIRADIVNGVGATTALEEILVDNRGTIRHFEDVAEDLMAGMIQSIQIAPEGKVTDIYPAQGNDAGKIDLINDPDRGEICRYSRDNHVMTMQGPFALKQGGHGIAVRNPVYLAAEDGSEEFWGFTIVIIRVPEVFAEAVDGLTGQEYNFRLSKTVSPWEETYEEVAGSGTVALDATAYMFELGGSQWKLEVSPAGGWYRLADLLVLFGCGMVLVLLVSGTQYVLLVQTDCREKIKLNEQLEKALADAQTANEAKSYFLNNMSHDLRTPLNAVLGFARLLEQEPGISAKMADYLGKIEESGEYLLSILNNMLSMARMESGESVLEERTCRIDPAQPLEARFGKEIREKEITYTQSVEIEHEYVRMDGDKVQRLFDNLIENAVKYTPAGGTIRVEFQEQPCEQEGWAAYRLTVADNGIGMSEEFQKHLFELFSRERNTTESKVIGTGLGLAIVKKLVDMMGGTIDVESRPGVGSTFQVYLSFAIAEAPQKAAEQESPQDALLKENVPEGNVSPLQGKRILLAEDNELNAEITMTILEDMGIQSERAEDGKVCVEMLQQADVGHYDLILMDIQMPIMDGYEATRTIRALRDPARSRIPIVALTANAFEEDRKRAFEAGMNDHLAKPIDLFKLEKALVSLFPV